MGKVSKNVKAAKGKVSGEKNMVKVIVTEKSEKTGAYVFKERIVHKDQVKDFLGN